MNWWVYLNLLMKKSRFYSKLLMLDVISCVLMGEETWFGPSFMNLHSLYLVFIPGEESFFWKVSIWCICAILGDSLFSSTIWSGLLLLWVVSSWYSLYWRTLPWCDGWTGIPDPPRFFWLEYLSIDFYEQCDVEPFLPPTSKFCYQFGLKITCLSSTILELILRPFCTGPSLMSDCSISKLSYSSFWREDCKWFTFDRASLAV